MALRTLHGILHRKVTMNEVYPVDLPMALFFDLLEHFIFCIPSISHMLHGEE